MEKTVTVTLLANAGLLVQYNGYSILLDALQRSENAPFSPLPPALWQEMLSASGRFSRVDALLFTHLHPDHFSADMTLQYLRRHPVPVVMMPRDPSVPGAEEAAALAGSHLLTLRAGAPVRYVLTPEISVLAIPTRHLDKRYHAVPHDCFLLTLGTKNLLVTADVDYTCETLSLLDGVPIDAAFVNPLFFSALLSNRFFKGELHAKQLCVYHIPFAADDTMNMRSSVFLHAPRWDKPSRVTVLSEPLQQLILP